MTEQLIAEIQRKMLPYLNNEQLMHLRDAMAETLEGATITYDSGSIPADETDAVEAFSFQRSVKGFVENVPSPIADFGPLLHPVFSNQGKVFSFSSSPRRCSWKYSDG